MSEPREGRTWERGWEGHREAQARRLAELSLAEKLEWLEEAHARVLNMRGGAGVVRESGTGPGAAEPPPS